MPTVFFTGFPGFLGRELLPRVLARSSDDRAVCLVQPKFAPLARQASEELTRARPELGGRIELVEGDITQPDLGLGTLAQSAEMRRNVREVWHLAAVYDLSVPRPVGMRINVDGTRHVLDLAAGCENLERVQYVSTCYVSGRWAGIFDEDDLEKGQRFNNFYEETKHLAEVDVRNRQAKGLPATIYRPSIVVGDSRTGVTQKYDGPYYVIQWLLRQPHTAIMPVAGDGTMVRLNVVPRDFVVDAIAALSARPETTGRCYQLADPNPLTVDEMVDVIGQATDRRVIKVPVPARVAKLSIDHVPGVASLLRMPSTLVDYMVHPTHYGTRDTRAALEPLGIRAPGFRDYVGNLVAFVRANPGVTSAAMI